MYVMHWTIIYGVVIKMKWKINLGVFRNLRGAHRRHTYCVNYALKGGKDGRTYYSTKDSLYYCS